MGHQEGQDTDTYHGGVEYRRVTPVSFDVLFWFGDLRQEHRWTGSEEVVTDGRGRSDPRGAHSDPLRWRRRRD